MSANKNMGLLKDGEFMDMTRQDGLTPARAASANAEAGGLTGEPILQGHWLWDPDERRVLWAEPEAIRAWRADSLGDLLDARFSDDDPLLVALKALRDRMAPGDSLVEGLRLMAGNRIGLHALCRMTARPLASGRTGLMMEILGPSPRYDASQDQPDPTKRRSAPLSALLSALGEAVAVLDGAGRITAANATATRLLDAGGESPVGRALIEFTAAEDRDGLAELIETGAGRLECTLTPAGGEELPVDLSLGAIQGAEPRRICVVLRDLSEAKTRETALREGLDRAERESRLKTDLLAQVSHELRTPLTAVIGFSELMAQGLAKDGASQGAGGPDYAQHVLEAGRQALALVEDLLDLTLAETGRMRLDPAPVDLAELLETCVRMTQPTAKQADLTLRLDPPAGSWPSIDADARSLRQALLSILTQLTQKVPSGGDIHLSQDRLIEGGLLVRIRAKAVGLNASDLVRLFGESADESGAESGETDGGFENRVLLAPGPAAGEGESGSDRTGEAFGLPLARALLKANGATLMTSHVAVLGGSERLDLEITFPEAGAASAGPV